MPTLDGIEVLRQMVREELVIPVLLLTAGISDSQLYDAIQLGVRGIILKSEAAESMLEAVAEITRGGHWWPDHIIHEAVAREEARRASGEKIRNLLTFREREIASIAINERSNKLIARELGIAEGTVKIHLNNIYSKLGVSNRPELAQALRRVVDFLVDLDK